MKRDAIISVQIRQPYGYGDIHCQREIPEATIEQCLQVIKTSSYDFCFLDTPATVAMKIRADREKVAKAISSIITSQIIQMFESKDLFNGYTKDEQKEMRYETRTA
jgi:hypothetical protein